MTSTHRPMTWKIFALVAGLVVLTPAVAQSQFNPPRVMLVLNKHNPGDLPDNVASNRSCYIDRGREASIHRGDELNVYREVYPMGSQGPAVRVQVGTMRIQASQTGSASGVFTLHPQAMGNPLIKYRTVLKGDIVVPKLIIDSSVLFDPGKSNLKAGAAEEFAKVAEFVRLFSPGKLVVEGHTDNDGPANYNKKLSEDRASVVRQYLIGTYDFITERMIDANGYGEEHPIVENNTDENKALNRRIEIVVWD